MKTFTTKSPSRWRQEFSPHAAVGLLGLLTALWVTFAAPRATAGPEISERQVKAAYLLNFPKYVEWPAETFATSNSPFVVTIVGDAGMSADFQKLIAGKTINGRPVVLQTLTASAAVTNDCHIMYLSGAARRAAELLPHLRGTSILTVSDDPNFLEQGGAIRLVRRDQNIRLEINLTAAHAARLKLSSKLLSVADVVKGTQK